MRLLVVRRPPSPDSEVVENEAKPGRHFPSLWHSANAAGSMLWFMKKDDKIRHLVLLFTLVTLFLLRLLSLAVFHNPLESLGTEQRALSV